MTLFSELFIISWNGAFRWLLLGAIVISLFKIPVPYITFTLKNIIVSFMIPLMIFYKTMIHLDSSRLMILPQYCLWAFIFLALSELTSRGLSKFGVAIKARPTFNLGNTFNNYGFVAYGLIEKLYGSALLTELFAFVIFTEIALWTRGRAFFSQGKFDTNILVRNPPLWAFTLALILKSSSTTPFGYAPHFDSVIAFMVSITVPLALIGLGGLIYHQKAHFRFEHILDKEVSLSLLLRHFIMPPLLFCLVFSLTEENLRKALMVETVMPSSLMTITLAKLYGGKVESISLMVFCSQVLSMITIPIWLALFIGP